MYWDGRVGCAGMQEAQPGAKGRLRAFRNLGLELLEIAPHYIIATQYCITTRVFVHAEPAVIPIIYSHYCLQPTAHKFWYSRMITSALARRLHGGRGHFHTNHQY